MDATVIKFGGSLSLHSKKLRNLCSVLDAASKKQRLVIVPGGAEFADLVRDLDRRFNLKAETSHQMAILAMDQYGYFLADLIRNSCLTKKLEDIQRILDSEKLPIFLPSTYFSNVKLLGNSWDVTSDSISLFIASQLRAKQLILVTDVDGIFTEDPKSSSDAKFISSISAKELESFGKRTSVDKFFPKLFVKSKVECYVVNGLYPERIEALLKHKETICTKIN